MTGAVGMEGWYTDPYDRHEARWMSDGHLANLVRDAGVESHEDPPNQPFAKTPTPHRPPR